MATREEVENAIAAIEDNGNNTAKEVRNVLKKLLDYAENRPIEKASESFELNNKREPIKEIEDRGTLLYSFKGFIEFHVNFSFFLKISKDEATQHLFTLPQDTVEVLRKIMTKNNLDFIVPLRQKRGESIRAASMNLQLRGQHLQIYLSNAQIFKGDFIKTSLQFHIPDSFNEND